MSVVESVAPSRIDLAGGTLDIPPLDQLVPDACTVNVAIDLVARVRVETIPSGVEILSVDRDRSLRCADLAGLAGDRELPLLSGLVGHFAERPGLRLTSECASPAGAGLGGSSALAVAAAAALARFSGRDLDSEALLRVSRDVETRVLQVPTGVQDYLAALRGGALSLTFPPGGRRDEVLPVDLEELRRRTVLVYSGRPRSSGINNWEVTRTFVEGDPDVRRRLEAIAHQAGEAREAVRAGDWDRLAAAVDGEWQQRRELAPGVSTPEIDAMMEAARGAGATAAKVCGAGGGGCVVLLSPPERREAVAEAARRPGMEILDFAFTPDGVQVREV